MVRFDTGGEVVRLEDGEDGSEDEVWCCGSTSIGVGRYT